MAYSLRRHGCQNTDSIKGFIQSLELDGLEFEIQLILQWLIAYLSKAEKTNLRLIYPSV
tara:strand:+ start:1033 stop:1209 length:177 start_codon:yes stop_codon:yes gene_type:complete